MESIMDYMMNDFRITYLCSRNHNESGCGSFLFYSPRITQINTDDNLFHPDGVNNKSMELLQLTSENEIICVNLCNRW